MRLRTDGFVLESNVHFPTDYNLLWDSAGKSIDAATKSQQKYKLPGWRKIENRRRGLKNKMRALGQAGASGGKGKQDRLKTATKAYLTKAKALWQKLEDPKDTFPQLDVVDALISMELERFSELLLKHIDLLERRVIKGEEIPHQEKVFSIFEQYTQWITKGKMHPDVGLGKKVAITADRFHLTVDCRIMEHRADSEIVRQVAEEIIGQYKIYSWGFDKGFWRKDNHAFLSPRVEKVAMPKKGKCNKAEQAHGKQPLFKKPRNKHSAIESNINELENRGLNRCPDKGYRNFKGYVGLAVCAYNLRRTGAELISQELTAREHLKRAA